MARRFFNQVQLHGELADLAFERSNVGLVLRDDAGLRLLIVQLAAIELRQPQLDGKRDFQVLPLDEVGSACVHHGGYGHKRDATVASWCDLSLGEVEG